MLSRRELITAGVAGGIVPAPAPAAAEPVEQSQAPDKEGQREIARSIKDVESVLQKTFQSASLSYGVVSKLRADMETFLRAIRNFRITSKSASPSSSRSTTGTSKTDRR